MLAVAGMTFGLLSLGQPPTAQAHSSGNDAVDGCEIRWEDEMSWDAYRQYAQSAWGALAYDDCVEFAADAWYTNTDLEWRQHSSSTSGSIGVYFPETSISVFDSTAAIDLNSYWMQRATECGRRWAAMHFLGHALGLANSYSGTVMAPNSEHSPTGGPCTLQAHDISDYEALWGSSNPPPVPPPDHGGPPTHTP